MAPQSTDWADISPVVNKELMNEGVFNNQDTMAGVTMGTGAAAANHKQTEEVNVKEASMLKSSHRGMISTKLEFLEFVSEILKTEYSIL